MRLTGALLELKKERFRSRNFRITTAVICCVDHAPPLFQQKSAIKIADQWQSLNWYNSLADKKPRNVLLFRYHIVRLFDEAAASVEVD
jgi:hypothetical protein